MTKPDVRPGTGDPVPEATGQPVHAAAGLELGASAGRARARALTSLISRNGAVAVLAGNPAIDPLWS